jgi:hypothetical protein
MNKISMTIVLFLCFAVSAFTQTPIISKGTTVVPKFALKWSDFKTKFGVLKGEIPVDKKGDGKLEVNNDVNWEAFPLFPGFDGNPDGLYSRVQKRDYSRPSVVSYKIDGIERKKDITEIKLSKSNDRIVDLKIIFSSIGTDFEKSFQEVFFIGSLDEYGKSEYFSNIVLTRLLEGTKLENASRESKVELMKNIGNDVNALKVYKQKLYLGSTFLDTVEYNSNNVNESERVVRTIQKSLSEIKKKFKVAAAINGIDGIKIESTLRFRNFLAKSIVDDTFADYDSFEFYVSIDALKLFDEAEITDQELIDKSVVLLNGNRIRVNLSQFSN